MAVDQHNKALFLGECKYHNKPVWIDIYHQLKEKAVNNKDIRKSYPDYAILYGIFSKSGFTSELINASKEETNLVLIDKDHRL